MSDDRRTQLIAAVEAVLDGLLDATDGLTEQEWQRPTGCPGWTVKDQLSHAVGIERTMLGEPMPQVELPELAHVDDDFSRAIEADVELRRPRSGEQVREEAVEVFERRRLALAELDEAALEAPMDGPGGMRQKGSSMLRTRVFDLATHEQDIRRAVERPRDPDGPEGAIAGEQVLRAWAKRWPEGPADAGVVEVEVVGPHATVREIPLGQASEPRVRLVGTVAQLLAVGCGRDDGPALTDLVVAGDRELAGRLAPAASVTP